MKKKKQRREKILITLSDEEIAAIKNVIKKGESKARVITRARILLLAHKGKTNQAIMDALDCSHDLIGLVRKRYRERGSVEEAIHDLPRPGQPKRITADHEAFIIATACTDAPSGHNHWTLGALRKKLLDTYDDLQSISDEWIRQMLVRATLKPWREKNVVRSQTHAGVSRAHG